MKNDYEARNTLAKDVSSGINDVIEGGLENSPVDYFPDAACRSRDGAPEE